MANPVACMPHGVLTVHPSGGCAECRGVPWCHWCGTENPDVMRSSPFADFCGDGCSGQYYEARRKAVALGIPWSGTAGPDRAGTEAGRGEQ